MYGFLLLFYSNFVRKTHRFEIFDFKNAVTLKTGLGVRYISIRWRAYDFLLMFYSNYGSISCRFGHIQCRKISRHWKSGQGSLEVIESGTMR